MTAFTAMLTRWRIEWLVLRYRWNLAWEIDQLEQRRKRFTMHTARIAEGLTPQEFLEYATTLRKLECNRAEHAQQLEVFVKLLRADHQTSDLEQIESLMRQLLSSSTMGKSIEAGGS